MVNRETDLKCSEASSPSMLLSFVPFCIVKICRTVWELRGNIGDSIGTDHISCLCVWVMYVCKSGLHRWSVCVRWSLCVCGTWSCVRVGGLCVGGLSVCNDVPLCCCSGLCPALKTTSSTSGIYRRRRLYRSYKATQVHFTVCSSSRQTRSCAVLIFSLK